MMKDLEVLIYKERIKEWNALAWHQIRMWWHTITINICKQVEEEKSFYNGPVKQYVMQERED